MMNFVMMIQGVHCGAEMEGVFISVDRNDLGCVKNLGAGSKGKLEVVVKLKFRMWLER